MKLLKEAIYRAVHGEGGLVFLCGEAGIGKTRLTRELGAYARLHGVQVLYGRCPALFRMDGVPPYILWKEVVKDYLETCTPEKLYRVIGDQPEEVSKLVPEIKKMLRTIPESFELSPEHSRDRLFEAVSQFITNISRETPLLVILDDLQWTDESSLLLMHYLTRGVYKESLLLLGAFRDTDVDDRHPLSAVLTELNRERLLQSVQLKRMSFDDVSELIKQILEQDDVSTEFCKLVYEKTRGNPFFAEEVIKSLKEEEVIYREDNRWKIKEVAQIEFPETVKSVIKKRISRLDDECQSILTLASFVGNDFSFEALCEVTGIEDNKLLELMEKIIKTGLVKERVVRGEDVYCFADVIVRDVAHEEVSHLRHKKLHNKVGCSLEKVYGEKIDEHLGELAYHFLEAGDKDKALEYFLKAGEKASKIYANSEAVSYSQSALKLLQEKEDELQEKGRVLERLGDIKSLIGEYDVSTKYWNEALLLWNQLNEKEKAARLHRKIANLLWDSKGETAKAEEHYDKALGILEHEPESGELASLYEDMAHMYYRTKDMTKAQSLAEKALELAKKLNALDVVASSYTSLGTIYTYTGDRRKAIECLEKALKIALDNGLIEAALRAYNNLASALPTEETKRGRETIEKGYDLAKKIGHIYFQSFMGTNIAWYHFGMGDVKKALSLAEESVALDRKSGNMVNLSFSIGTLALIHMVLGDWDKCEKYIKEKIDITEKLNDIDAVASSYSWLGILHFNKGEYPEARALYEKAYEVCEKAGAKYNQMWMSTHVIWMAIELGELEKANNLLDKVYEFASNVKDRELVAWADARKGMMFRAQKKWEDSIQHFEKSIRELEALGWRQYNVYFFAQMFLYEYARVYLERDQPGDREKANKLLNQALELFQKMDARKDIEKVEAKLLYIERGKAVSVPKSIDLVATGYVDLDKLLCGGIPQNYAVVLTSPSCDERDMLIKSFLEAGAKKGEVTFFVTIDPSAGKPLAEEFQSNFYLFVCNPEADAIIKSSPNVFTLKGVENLTNISIALTSAIRRLDPSLKAPRRVCLGLVSDVLLQHHAIETRRWLTALMTKLKSEDFTTLAVVDPKMHPSEELYAILGLFEGEINIYEKETEKGSERFLKIKKMSNQKYVDNELLLKKGE
jgi:predicted ATPase/KaiC/GvpD/RAD55 family RecA-like ATPase